MTAAKLVSAAQADPTLQAGPSTQRLDKAAHQFEAMLLQELLKPLTASEEESGDAEQASLGGSSASGPLQSFGMQAVAESLANSGALGFAKQIENSLQHRAAVSSSEEGHAEDRRDTVSQKSFREG